MKLSYLFIANAIFAGFAGLGMLFATNAMFAPYNMTLNDTGTFMARVMGFLLLGIAAISWLARKIKDEVGKTAILSGFAISHLGTGVLALMGALSGVYGTPMWFDVVIHGALGSGFAYYLFGKK